MKFVARPLAIEQERGDKGRSFHATLLACITADALWSGGRTDTEATRPVWAALAGSDAELRAFVANLRTGHKAEFDENRGWSRRGAKRFEVLRSAGYEFSWQRTPLGSVVTLYLPNLFMLDPGMVDPEGIAFCILPSAEWLRTQAADVSDAVAHLRKLGYDREDASDLVHKAALFSTYLDRRTRCPLIPDIRFQAQLLAAALACGMASFPEPEYSYSRDWGVHRRFGYKEDGVETLGYLSGVACHVTHDDFEEFLARQVSLYFKTIGEFNG